MEVKPDFYQHLLENLFDGIYYVDINRRITYWNKAAERITGFSQREVIGHRCSDNILQHIDAQGTDLCRLGCPLSATLRDRRIREAEVYLHHKHGHRVPIAVRVAPILNDHGDLVGAAEIFAEKSSRDIMAQLESLQKEVLVDHLTGFGNRKYAEVKLQARLHDWLNFQIPFGVLFIDIDHFKRINDTFGHGEGDRVLVMVAKTIAGVLRSMDSIARWGGEEFLVILPNVDEKVLAQIAERIRVFVEKSWLMAGDDEVRVTVSIGGELACRNASIEALVQEADRRMYLSKREGRNRITLDGTRDLQVDRL